MKETLSIGLWLVLTGAAITAVIFVAQTMRSKEPVSIGLYRNREHTVGSLIYLALVVIGGMAIVGAGVYGLLTWLPSSADQFRGMLAVGAAFCSLFILAHLERVTFIRQELAVNNASLTWIDYQLHYSSRPSDGEIERLKEESRDPNKTDTELQIARWTLALAKEMNERDKRTETQVILRLQREQEEKEAKDADRERLAAQKAAKEQTLAINLQELLKQDFGIDFPISGGAGNSKDAPIIIHRRVPNDPTSVEYGILRCLGIGRGVDWAITQQVVMDYAGRTLDQLKVQTKEITDNEIITQVENYYFDITECMAIPRLTPVGNQASTQVEAAKLVDLSTSPRIDADLANETLLSAFESEISGWPASQGKKTKAFHTHLVALISQKCGQRNKEGVPGHIRDILKVEIAELDEVRVLFEKAVLDDYTK